MDNSTKKALQGFLIGAAAGIAAGILLAPSTGKETRNKIAKSAKNLTGKVSDQLGEALGKISEYTESTFSSLTKTETADKTAAKN